jgi:hypothetical protein
MLAAVALFAVVGLTNVGLASASVTTQFGFNEWNDPSNYSLQAQLNTPIRRMLIGWNEVQSGWATWDWSQSDTVYAALLAHRLMPLIMVQSAPCWANPEVSCGAGGLPPDRAHYSAWSRFIRRLAARYPAAVAIEIWNEPNLPGQWIPRPDAVAYTALLKSAYRAIKSVDPWMPVISGGLFASPPVPGGDGDSQFLSAMYAAGAKGYMDGIGIHPYPVTSGPTPTFDIGVTERTLDRIRAVRSAAQDEATPLYITEMGLSTQTLAESAPAVSEPVQAADLLALLREVAADGDVKVALIHRLVDQPIYAGYPASGFDGYGVFNPDGTPKLVARTGVTTARSRKALQTSTCRRSSAGRALHS